MRLRTISPGSSSMTQARSRAQVTVGWECPYGNVMKLPCRTTRATPVARKSRVAVVISSSGSAPPLTVSWGVALASGVDWAGVVRGTANATTAIAAATRELAGIIMGELLRQVLRAAARLLAVGRRSWNSARRVVPAALPESRRST